MCKWEALGTFGRGVMRMLVSPQGMLSAYPQCTYNTDCRSVFEVRETDDAISQRLVLTIVILTSPKKDKPEAACVHLKRSRKRISMQGHNADLYEW